MKFLICLILYYVFQVENGEVSEVLEGEVIQNNENEGKAALLLPLFSIQYIFKDIMFSI